MNQFDPSELNAPQDSPWYYILNDTLIKKRKPCLEGNYIHFHSIEGCYRVHRTTVRGISIMKNREMRLMPWSDFRCLEGHGKGHHS